MKMYTLADKAIAPEEFSRAVTICTGRQLSPYVVKTVFQVKNKKSIFDNPSFYCDTIYVVYFLKIPIKLLPMYLFRFLITMVMDCSAIKNLLP